MNKTIESLDWYGKILECVEKLPADERAELDEWDKNRPEGVASTDWPGFAKYNLARPEEDELDAKLRAFDDLFDPDECSPFAADPDTIAILARVGEVIKKRFPDDAYEWIDDLAERLFDVRDRMEKLNIAQKESKYIQ